MNNRTSTVPLTPDLQLYKLHHKSKGRKKQNYPAIQPTQPPQPIHDQYDISPKNYKCSHHPQKKAEYHYKTQSGYKGLCSLCAFTLNNGGEKAILDNEKYEKKDSLDKFKNKVIEFKQVLVNRQSTIYQLLSEDEKNYNQYIVHLNESFERIINDLDEKHQQMNNALCESIQKRRKSISNTFSQIQQIKQSVDRYIYDINKNYEEILQELSIDNFRDVMEQYNAKIEYYNSEILNKMKINESINVYFPVHEIERMIEKASVSYYDRSLDEEKVNNFLYDRMERKSQLLKIQKKKQRCQTFKENKLHRWKKE